MEVIYCYVSKYIGRSEVKLVISNHCKGRNGKFQNQETALL